MAVAVLASGGVAGCGGSERSAAESATAETRNRAQVNVPAPTLHPEKTSSVEIAFRPAGLLDWANDSTLAVGDHDSGEVVLLGLDGAEKRRFGRKGGGPGEFVRPFVVRSGPQQDLYVLDDALRRVTRLAPDGEYLSSAPVPGLPLNVLHTSGDLVTGVWTTPVRGPVVGQIDLATGIAAERFLPYAQSPALARASTGVAGPTRFLASAPGPDGITLLGGGDLYEVHRFDSNGTPLGVLGRPDVRPVTRSDAELAELSEKKRLAVQLSGISPGLISPEISKELRERPKPFFLAGGLAVDDRGRTWVATTVLHPDSTGIDVFDPEDRFVASLVVPGTVQKIAVRPPYLAVLRTTATGPRAGTQGIDVYRIIDR